MVTAYVLINTAPGTLPEAARQMTQIPGVRRVDAVTGPYDAIAIAEAETTDMLGKIVVSQIQKAAGVQKTLTCLVVAL